LAVLITAQPDMTLAELRDALPTTAALSTLWLEIDGLGLTVKKTGHADEQRRPDVATARRQWRATLPVHDAHQYVFVDESGVTTDLLRRYARSPRDTLIADHTPCGRWQTHTIVAAGIAELGRDRQRREIVDAPEAPQPLHAGRQRLEIEHPAKILLHRLQACDGLIDRAERGYVRLLKRGQRPRFVTKPRGVALRPVLPRSR
jgi:hypothetical protein